VKNVRADISESAYDYMQLLNILQFPKKKPERVIDVALAHRDMLEWNHWMILARKFKLVKVNQNLEGIGLHFDDLEVGVW